MIEDQPNNKPTICLTPATRAFLKLFASLLISSPALILYFKSTQEQDIYTRLSSMGANEIINLWAAFMTLSYLSSLGDDCSLRNVAKQLAALIGSTLCSVPASIATYTFTDGTELKRLLYALGDLGGSIPLYYYSMIQLMGDLNKLRGLPDDIAYLINNTFYSEKGARERESYDIELARRALKTDLKTLERAMDQTDFADLVKIQNILSDSNSDRTARIQSLMKKYPPKNSSSFWKTGPGKAISLGADTVQLSIKIVLSGILIWGSLGYFCGSKNQFSQEPFKFNNPGSFASALTTNLLLFLLCRSGGWNLAESSWNYISRCIEISGFAPTTLSKVGFGGWPGKISQLLLLAGALSIAFKSGYTSRILYTEQCSWVNESFVPQNVTGNIVDYSTVAFNGIYVLLALTTFFIGLIHTLSADNSPKKAYLDDQQMLTDISNDVQDMGWDEILEARKEIRSNPDEETGIINDEHHNNSTGIPGGYGV